MCWTLVGHWTYCFRPFPECFPAGYSKLLSTYPQERLRVFFRRSPGHSLTYITTNNFVKKIVTLDLLVNKSHWTRAIRNWFSRNVARDTALSVWTALKLSPIFNRIFQNAPKWTPIHALETKGEQHWRIANPVYLNWTERCWGASGNKLAQILKYG